MRTVVGYIDGKPQWSPSEPARGHATPRVGGMAMAGGFPLGYVVVGQVRDHNANRSGDPNAARTRRNRKRSRYTDQPRCGTPLSVNQNATRKELCGRMPGHRPGHRSRAAMDAENVRRTGHGMAR